MPGFVAGVTNPMFQQHDNWFDLLCVLDLPNKKGSVQTAEERRAEEAAQKGKPYNPPPKSPDESLHESVDSKFILSVLSGVEAKLGEEWVRSQFFEYTQAILSDAHDISHRSSSIGRFDSFEIPAHAASAPSTPTHHSPEILSVASYSSTATAASTMSRQNVMMPLTRGSSGLQPPPTGHNGLSLQLPQNLIEKVKKRIEANRVRIRLLSSTSEYQSLPNSPWAWTENEMNLFPLENEEDGTISGELLTSQIRRLQTESNLDEIEIEAIYSILVRGVTTESSLQALLTLLSISGGLNTLAVGLFHTNPRIRMYAMKLLSSLEKYPSTRAIYYSMNQYYKYAIQRNQSLFDDSKGNGVNGRSGSITR